MLPQSPDDRLRRWTSARLRAPQLELTVDRLGVFERLVDSGLQHGPATPIEYDCPYPKHEFLTYLVERRGFLLHGSRDRDIRVFEPREAHDLFEFSSQRALYAASDGIWPMVFAIRVPSTRQVAFINGCSRAQLADGTLSPAHYHFAVAAEGLREQSWTDGMLYVLPRTTFVPHPTQEEAGLTVTLEEWATSEPIVPIMKVEVRPEDFPFVDEFWGYDPRVVQDRYRFFDPDGQRAWTEFDHADRELFPIAAPSFRRG